MEVVCLLIDFDQSDDSVTQHQSKSDLIQKLAESCLAWTPQIAISPEAIFLEIGKCKNLYTHVELFSGLRTILDCFDIKARVAVGRDIPQALSFARHGLVKKDQLPIQSIEDFFDPFQVDRLQKNQTQANQGIKLDKMIELLKKLGIQTLGDFAQLPHHTLASRFGQTGLQIYRRIEDASYIPWPHFKPEEKIKESHLIEEARPLDNLEPIFFIAKKLVDRALYRVYGKKEKITKISFTLELEPYSTLKDHCPTWIVDYTLPQSTAAGVLSVLKQHIESDLNQNPLQAPIIKINLEILETAPGLEQQRNFFSKKEDDMEAWASLVNRISEKIGKESVFFAAPVERYLPEKAWIRTINSDECSEVQAHPLGSKSLSPSYSEIHLPVELHLPYPERPLRLMNNPLPLFRVGPYLFLNDKNKQRKKWKILQVKEPENINGEWWWSNYKRTYYRIITDTLEQFWIFKSQKSSQLYLHGVFD